MKVGELIDLLKKFDADEEIEMIAFEEEDMLWYEIRGIERFIEEDESSPLTIISGKRIN